MVEDKAVELVSGGSVINGLPRLVLIQLGSIHIILLMSTHFDVQDAFGTTLLQSRSWIGKQCGNESFV